MIERRTEALVEEVLDGLGPRRPPASREDGVARAAARASCRRRRASRSRPTCCSRRSPRRSDLAVDEPTLDAHIDRLAETAGKARERVRALYQDAGARDGLRSRLLQERALDLVVERAGHYGRGARHRALLGSRETARYSRGRGATA